MGTVFRRLKRLVQRAEMACDLAEEMETHRLMTERRLRDSGMTAAGAEAASRRIMGNVSLAREEARAVWVWSWLDSTRQDISYAVRSLRRRPGFACLALATLGAAIGVNTTLFTVFNAVFLRPWPVPDGSSVFEVTITHDDRRTLMEEFSLGELRHLQDHAQTVAGLMASKCGFERDPDCRVLLDDRKVASLFVSRNYFAVLGIGLERGPGFSRSEDSVEAEVVISQGVWQERFGGDSSIIGRPVRLNEAVFTVVGFSGNKPIWVRSTMAKPR